MTSSPRLSAVPPAAPPVGSPAVPPTGSAAAAAGPPRLRRPPEPSRTASTVTRIRTRPPLESEVPTGAVQGALALDLSAARGAPPVPELSVVPASSSVQDARAAEVRRWAARFAQAVVEVTGGDRPVTQMLRWTSARVYQDLDRRVRVLGQTGSAGQRRRVVRPQVRSVHVCLPTARSAEVSVHVRYGQRSRALAARLELRSGRWTCTALQLG